MKRASFVVLGLLFAFACKKSEQATSTTQASTTTVNTSATATPPQPAPTTPVPATTTSAPVPAAPAGVIATTESDQGGVRIDITELKRSSGGTVNLKFVITNNGDKGFSMASERLADHEAPSDYRSVSGIHLVDPVNKKKYFVVRDSEKNCLCSQAVDDVKEGGGRVTLWAKFPAPPPEVQKITIQIPHFQPIDDAPISQ